MVNYRALFVGIPGTRETPTMVWDHFGQWLRPSELGKWEVAFRCDTSSGHLDLARTRLLRLGQESNAGLIAQKDADVIIETPFRDVMSFLAEDFSQGAGIVFSPTTSIDWRPQVKPIFRDGHPDPEPRNDAPFAAFAGAGGFMVMTKEVVDTLQPVGWTNVMFGTESGRPERVELLCVNRPGLDISEPIDEDFSLMRNVAESTGMLVVCDPRILTGHLKPVYRPSWRPMDKLNEVVR